MNTPENEKTIDQPGDRLIAFYLPQYHPIPENDDWWGKGFTEWTNSTKARPLFPGHQQPNLPADLGFYDLRVPEAREAQANLAREYGVEAFCYYHYWFAGRRILERPFEEVLRSEQPDFPFCLCWANQTWTGIWHGAPGRVLIEQTYPGLDDYRRHFEYLLPAFWDRRYIRVDGKPVFIIYNPNDLPDPKLCTDFWRDLAVKAGLPGLFLIAESRDTDWDPKPRGFDEVLLVRLPTVKQSVAYRTKWWKHPLRKASYLFGNNRGWPTIHEYADVIDYMIPEPVSNIDPIPCVIPNWDNTPRSGMLGTVLHGSTPKLFRKALRQSLKRVAHRELEQRFVFIKSWNEWAEGNYLEPDRQYGHAYLEVVRDEFRRSQSGQSVAAEPCVQVPS
jgi:lipopolysaccharide biosynthesis protein